MFVIPKDDGCQWGERTNARAPGGTHGTACLANGAWGYSFPPASPLFFLALVCGPGVCWGAPEGATPPAISWEQFNLLMLIGGLITLLGLVSLVVNIWDKLKPKPPAHERFAPLQHEHPAYVSRADLDKHHAACERERRHEVKHQTADREALQRQLDHLGTSIKTGLETIERKSDERSEMLHQRISGIAKPLNQMIGRFEEHLEAARQKEHLEAARKKEHPV